MNQKQADSHCQKHECPFSSYFFVVVLPPPSSPPSAAFRRAPLGRFLFTHLIFSTVFQKGISVLWVSLWHNFDSQFYWVSFSSASVFFDIIFFCHCTAIFPPLWSDLRTAQPTIMGGKNLLAQLRVFLDGFGSRLPTGLGFVSRGHRVRL